MRIRINGTTQPIRGRTKVSYDPQHGLQVGVPWESAGNNLGGIASAYEALRIAYDFEPNGRKSTLIAKPTGGQLGIPNKSVDEWQLLPNEQQLSLMYHPTALALSDEQRRNISDGINENTKFEDMHFSTPEEQAVYEHLRNGVTHFALGVPVLRHTTNVWDGYTNNVANVNVEKIYSTSELLEECGPSRGWVYPIPNGIAGSVSGSGSNDFFVDRAGYFIGWRKLPPNWATAAGNRIAVTTEYWFGQHDLFIYSRATF